MISRRKRLIFCAILVALPFLALTLLEGTASLVLFARDVYRLQMAIESYTERDTLLGWQSKATFHKASLYAPGVGLTTNGQRFRHRGEVSAEPVAGRRRVVCSGDSFTFGYGVGDDDTWCAMLSARVPSLETINMGQSAYGLDQAYLWYLRDGLRLHPQVHLVAVITNDFHRMPQKEFGGYPKPRLVADGSTIRAIDVPVRRPGLGPFMAKVLAVVPTLRMSDVLRHFTGPRRPVADRVQRDSATWEVSRLLFADLVAKNKGAGGLLVVVYLPKLDDYAGHAADHFRRWAHAAAARGEFRFIDLVEPFRAVRADSVPRMFIANGVMPFKGAAGHYTTAGNAWVTGQLLRAIPELTHP